MARSTTEPTHVFQVLESAALNTPNAGCIYLNDGWAGPPTRIKYSQLYLQAKANATRLIDIGIVSPGQIVITYFDSHQENALWFWSVVAAGGICAVLNPISNEPKTAAGQLDNLKTLFDRTPVLTSHKLSAIFASRGLNVRTIEQVAASPLSPKSAAVKVNGLTPTNGEPALVNGAPLSNGESLVNGHALANGNIITNGEAVTKEDAIANGGAPTNGLHINGETPTSEVYINGTSLTNGMELNDDSHTNGDALTNGAHFDNTTVTNTAHNTDESVANVVHIDNGTNGLPVNDEILANEIHHDAQPLANGVYVNGDTITNGDALTNGDKPSHVEVPNGAHVETEIQTNGFHLSDTLASTIPQNSLDDIAVILFTSGSTGHSKAVKFSHGQLIKSVIAKSNYLGTKDMTFMSWISFDHSACFCEVHLQSVYNGTDQVFVPTSEFVQTPERFFDVLSMYRVGYTFSPNFFLAAAASALDKSTTTTENIDLSHLRVIMCGGEANRTGTLEKTNQILRRHGAPEYSIKAAYGLSETCSACFYNLQSPDYDVLAENTFASVGKPLPPGLDLKIVSRGDDEDQAGQGLIYLRGDVVFKGYHHNDAATKACMTDDGWMNTGDIGKLDANGNLHLLGRAKEVLILNGNNYSSFEIEYALESIGIPGLTTSFTAVFSTWDQGRDSEAVVVLFNPTEAAIGPKNMRATIQAIDKCIFNVCAQRALHIIPLPKVLLPKSTIGKLSRAKLKQAFEAGAFEDYIIDDKVAIRGANQAASDQLTLDQMSPLQQEIAKIYSTIVNVPAEELLGPDALLASGINSLGFMRLKKALEKGLKIHQEIPMPLLLRCHSIVELEHELVLLGTVSHQYDPIVPLHTGGEKQPLFCLHPGSGEFLCWVGLLKYMQDRPVYALRSKGLHPGEGTFSSLEETLECYYTAIRRVQPKGPYAMIGYCLGGLLSFELAKMFEAAGETVNFCGGIDNPPSLKATIGQLQYRSLMIDVLPVVTELTEEQALQFQKDTAGLTDEEFYEVLFTKFSPEFIENMDITVPRLQAFGRVEDSMRVIADKYVPSGSVSTADIFCADPMPHFGYTPEAWKRDVLGEWRSYVKEENVTFHHVDGTHISLIKEPQLPHFAQQLNDALRLRGI